MLRPLICNIFAISPRFATVLTIAPTVQTKIRAATTELASRMNSRVRTTHQGR